MKRSYLSAIPNETDDEEDSVVDEDELELPDIDEDTRIFEKVVSNDITDQEVSDLLTDNKFITKTFNEINFSDISDSDDDFSVSSSVLNFRLIEDRNLDKSVKKVPASEVSLLTQLDSTVEGRHEIDLEKAFPKALSEEQQKRYDIVCEKYLALSELMSCSEVDRNDFLNVKKVKVEEFKKKLLQKRETFSKSKNTRHQFSQNDDELIFIGLLKHGNLKNSFDKIQTEYLKYKTVSEVKNRFANRKNKETPTTNHLMLYKLIRPKIFYFTKTEIFKLLLFSADAAYLRTSEFKKKKLEKLLDRRLDSMFVHKSERVLQSFREKLKANKINFILDPRIVEKKVELLSVLNQITDAQNKWLDSCFAKIRKKYLSASELNLISSYLFEPDSSLVRILNTHHAD
eukprot:augustus_masked-scaffold_3-processed-gene-15.5-mRNA-1 protein AED:1.00 eAED:1.00 QI:0/-1/0/0/-1/1/1/0/399